MNDAKPVMQLSLLDILEHPIWKYLGDDSDVVIPDVDLPPVSTPDGRIFGLDVELADGSKVRALIGNVSTSQAKNCHFVTISIFLDKEFVYIPRYHDIGYLDFDFVVLASRMQKELSSIFPIGYDLAGLLVAEITAGKFHFDPKNKLTRADLIELAIS